MGSNSLGGMLSSFGITSGTGTTVHEIESIVLSQSIFLKVLDELPDVRQDLDSTKSEFSNYHDAWIGRILTTIINEDRQQLEFSVTTQDSILCSNINSFILSELRKTLLIKNKEKIKELNSAFSIKYEAYLAKYEQIFVEISRLKDKSRGVILEQDNSELKRLERELVVVTSVLAEIQKNKEINEINMLGQLDNVFVMDQTLLGSERNKPGWIFLLLLPFFTSTVTLYISRILETRE